ncbi:MAG: MCE family protein [Candidatus Omnitrophica bacterium]|nr:MCE family protein [Candidatus Omnitrophota bacterium]
MSDSESRMFELKVGIFIAVGIIIFFILVFSIGDVYLVRKGYYIETIFNFANGITKSAPVRLAGVNIGQVDKTEIFFDEEENKIKVKLLVWVDDENVRIPRDSKAFINTLGLLGEKYLEIFPGSEMGDFLSNKDILIGYDPIPTQLLTEKLSTLCDSADTVMKRLKDGEGTIGKLLTKDKIYNDLEEFVEDIKEHPWKLLQKPRSSDR